MFGKNPIAKNDTKLNGHHLTLVKDSPFYTLQGEGPNAGFPAVFIRLHGCNLRCWFCDTQFSDPDDPIYHVDEIILKVLKHDCELVVITGGEPLRQNIAPLCRRLRMEGIRVQIETAGTLWVDGIGGSTEIVVSPKTPVIHRAVQQWATAFKYVVHSRMLMTKDGIPITATQRGTKDLPLARPLSQRVPVYYSPMDEYNGEKNKENLAFAAELAMHHRRRLTTQMHKLVGLP